MEKNEAKRGKSPKNTWIYLTVDTKNINEGNIDEKVVFSDDRDDPPQEPGKPMDYVSTISPGMKVYWKGQPKDEGSGDVIEITGVTAKDGKDKWKLLDSVGPEKGNKGVRVGKVKEKHIDGQEPYSVRFRIEGRKSEFEVDPKIQMELKSNSDSR